MKEIIIEAQFTNSFIGFSMVNPELIPDVNEFRYDYNRNSFDEKYGSIYPIVLSSLIERDEFDLGTEYDSVKIIDNRNGKTLFEEKLPKDTGETRFI